MNIIPSGIVNFCKSVKISKNNQRDFKTLDEQKEYFRKNTVYIATKVQFIRAQAGTWSGTIKVPVQYYTLYNCDYLFYQNIGFSDKIFYCYITGVEYIDTNTTAVQFAVDFYQTFLMEYTIDRNTITRQHFTNVETNEMFDNYIDDVVIKGKMELKQIEKLEYQPIQGDPKHGLVLVQGFKNKIDEFTNLNNVVFNNQVYQGEIFITPLQPMTQVTVKQALDEVFAFQAGLNRTLDFLYIYPNINGIFTDPEVVEEPALMHTTRKLKEYGGFHTFQGRFRTLYNPKQPAKLQHQPYIQYNLRFQNGDGIDGIDIGGLANKQYIDYVLVPQIATNRPQLTMYLVNYLGMNTFDEGGTPFNYDYKVTTYDFPAISLQEQGINEMALSLIKLGYSGFAPMLANGEFAAQMVNANLDYSIPKKEARQDANKKYKHIQLNNRLARNKAKHTIQTLSRDASDMYQTYLEENERERTEDFIRQGRKVINAAETEEMIGYKDDAAQAIENFCSINLQPSIHGGGSGGEWTSGFVFSIAAYQYVLSQIEEIRKYCDRYGYSCYIVDEIWHPKRNRYDYVLCSDIIINGDIPQEAKAYIGQMFTDGVTFWHDDNIFDYSQNGDVQ